MTPKTKSGTLESAPRGGGIVVDVLTPELGTTVELQSVTLWIPRNKSARKGYIRVSFCTGDKSGVGSNVHLAVAQFPHDINMAVSGNQPSTPAMVSRHTHPHDLASWMKALQVTLGPDTPLRLKVDNYTDEPTEVGAFAILYTETAESTGGDGGEDGGGEA